MNAIDVIADLRALAIEAAARHALCTSLAKCPRLGALVQADQALFEHVADALAERRPAVDALAALRARLPRCPLLGARRS
jgi:hypothetical protein